MAHITSGRTPSRASLSSVIFVRKSATVSTVFFIISALLSLFPGLCVATFHPNTDSDASHDLIHQNPHQSSIQSLHQPHLSQSHQHHHHPLLHPRRAQFDPRTASSMTAEPAEHIQWMKNITASIGRNATFECRFPNLGRDFRLAWFHRERHTLLALHDSVIIKNGRVSVRSHANSTFYLTIHDIRESDRGVYMCQVNTVPMQKQFAYLEVSVPPTFVERYTSSDVDVDEGASVSLSCVARGRPEPEITWRREDNQPIVLETRKRHNRTKIASMNTVKGNQLNITASHRTQTGAFLCIAANGIPSPIAKRIFLGVIFPPIVKSNKESVGVYEGNSVTIDCPIDGYPRPSVYWQKDDRMPPILSSDRHYEIDLHDENVAYRFIARLKIRNFSRSDVGKYTCVAKNSAGEDRASLKMYKLERPTPKPAIQKAKSLFLDLFASNQMTTLSPLYLPESTSRRSQNSLLNTPKTPLQNIGTSFDKVDFEDDENENSEEDFEQQYISPGRERFNKNRESRRRSSSSAASTRSGSFQIILSLLFAMLIGWRLIINRRE